MRTIEELINLERIYWTQDEKNIVQKFPSLKWMIKFKGEWDRVCKQINKGVRR